MSSTASSQSTPNSEISAKEVRGASLHPYQQANAVEKSGVQHRVVSSNTIDINQPIHLSGAALSFDPRNGHVNSGLAEKPLSKKQRKKRNKARREATANASSANASTPTDLEACFAAFTIDTGLKTGSKKHRQARSAFIVREFSAYFGADCRLDNWLMLCDDLGIDTYGLTSITKCKKVSCVPMRLNLRATCILIQ